MRLLGDTLGALAHFPTVEAVEAAGYVSIEDDRFSGWEHFVNWSYLGDGRQFDSTAIESIVARVNPDGSRTVASALYIMNVGKTMADVPDIAGELSARGFHDHQNLCFNGTTLAGLGPPCPAGSVLLPTPPMLHVWQIPSECGPFATVEGHGGAGCAGHGH